MSSTPDIQLSAHLTGCYSMMLANWYHVFVVATRYIVLFSINSDRYAYVLSVMRLPQTSYAQRIFSEVMNWVI